MTQSKWTFLESAPRQFLENNSFVNDYWAQVLPALLHRCSILLQSPPFLIPPFFRVSRVSSFFSSQLRAFAMYLLPFQILRYLLKIANLFAGATSTLRNKVSSHLWILHFSFFSSIHLYNHSLFTVGSVSITAAQSILSDHVFNHHALAFDCRSKPSPRW